MTEFLKNLTMTYLLCLLLGLLLVGLGIFIAKKNAFLSSKRLIVYILDIIAVLTLSALLGFLNYAFMLYSYLTISVLYLFLGWLNIWLIVWVFKDNTDCKYRHEIALSLFLQLTGMLYFTLVFSLCNDLRYGLWASISLLSSMFFFLFVQSYRLFESIYTFWKFHDSRNVNVYNGIDFWYLKAVNLEIYKEDDDRKALFLKGKVPDHISFGFWDKCISKTYNMSFPQSPIPRTAG